MLSGICPRKEKIDLRVAFFLFGGKGWQGGRNYLANLLSFLSKYEIQSLQPVLYVPHDLSVEDKVWISALENVEVINETFMDNLSSPWSLFKTLLLGKNNEVERVLNREQIDVFFEAGQFLGNKSAIASVAWFPDLQHVEMPHLFPPLLRMKRDLGFRAQIRAGRTIMVSSNHALSVVEKNYPAARDSIYVASFAVRCPDIVDEESRLNITKKYKLPEKFIFLPNQFWRHKNHSLVLEALLLLKESKLTPTIVCTGAIKDHRDREFFDELVLQRNRSGLQYSFRILGQIPYRDTQVLLQSSKALLNPSLYEGWSTTVEEGKAANIPMLLSDIDVHKEQMAGQRAWYFSKNDSKDLAEKLRIVWESKAHRRADPKDLIVKSEDACAVFAAKFKGIVIEARKRRLKGT